MNAPIRFETHPGYRPLDVVRDDQGYAEVPRPTEFLLPQIRKHITIEGFPFETAASANQNWGPEALRAKVTELGPWEYYFELGHELSTRINSTFNDGTIRFHRQEHVELYSDFLRRCFVGVK